MVPVPADIVLPREVLLVRQRKAFRAITAHCPHPSAREAEVSLGSQLVTGMTLLRGYEAATVTYFPNFLLWCEYFGEELQVDLSIL